MPNLFQTFLNKVNRGYGQVDKNIFGGLLPGGAATPIGAAVQRAKPEFRPDPVARRVASLADVATTAAAKTQPFVENLVKTSPAPVQDLLSSGLNALPFSVNLFGRYYTGLGSQGLEIPKNILTEIKPQLTQLEKDRDKIISATEGSVKNFQRLLNLTANPASNQSNSIPSSMRKEFNDEFAANKSYLARLKQGELPYSGYSSNNVDPLSSPSTSLGSVWFKPTDKGYTGNEIYDFEYGGVDNAASFGPFVEEVIGVPALLPSQNHLVNMAKRAAMVPGAAQAPLANLGRAIVSKMPNKKFDYTINVP
jgi:hypothetical protein